jgi:hypothetical protein
MFELGRFRRRTTFEERLTAEAVVLRKRAALLPPGTEREVLLRRALQDETAADLSFWIGASGSRPPN